MIGKVIGIVLVLLIFALALYIYIPHDYPKFGLENYPGVIKFALFICGMTLAYVTAMVLRRYVILDEMERLEEDYLSLLKSKKWQEAENILAETRINEFSENTEAQKKVMIKCRPFIKKNYPEVLSDYPVEEDLVNGKKYYDQAMGCVNAARSTQAIATEKAEELHDTCINKLKKESPEGYKLHMNEIMGPLGQNPKIDQFQDCKKRIE